MKAEKILNELVNCKIHNFLFNRDNIFTLEDFAEALQQIREIEAAFNWMSKFMKWREDVLRNNLIDGTEGGYSDGLQSILDLLDKIRENK